MLEAWSTLTDKNPHLVWSAVSKEKAALQMRTSHSNAIRYTQATFRWRWVNRDKPPAWLIKLQACKGVNWKVIIALFPKPAQFCSIIGRELTKRMPNVWKGMRWRNLAQTHAESKHEALEASESLSLTCKSGVHVKVFMESTWTTSTCPKGIDVAEIVMFVAGCYLWPAIDTATVRSMIARVFDMLSILPIQT